MRSRFHLLAIVVCCAHAACGSDTESSDDAHSGAPDAAAAGRRASGAAASPVGGNPSDAATPGSGNTRDAANPPGPSDGGTSTQPSEQNSPDDADTNGDDAEAPSSGLCARCGGCDEQLPVTSAQHVTGPVDYPDPPPVGGPHSQCWGEWGVQGSELKPERWVHNLEHGGVVLLYHCEDSCESDVASLRTFVAAHPRTLLTSYAKLPQRFAIVSWGQRLVSDCVDLEALERFYAAHYDHGPESIADGPSSTCSQRPEL